MRETAQVSRWSDAKSFVWLADLLLIVAACSGLAGSGPSQWAAAGTAVVTTGLLVGISRTSVSVDRRGFIVQGVLHRRRIPWNDVLSVEVVEGPAWVAFVMHRPRSASRRSTRRRLSTTVLQHRDGSRPRPLILQCSSLPGLGPADQHSSARLAEERPTS